MATREELLEEIQGAFRKVLNNPTLTIDGNSSAQDVNGWDSLTHVMIISEIERQFKIRFSIKEMLSWKTVGNMIDSLQAKVG